MATVTTTNSPEPVLRPFAKSNDPSAPFAELKFVSTFTVAVKDAANESEVIVSAVMPAHYVYRLQALEIFGASSADTVWDISTGFERAWTVTLTENQVSTRRFGLFNQMRTQVVRSAVKIDPDAVTNDFGTWFAPTGVDLGDQLIDAREATSIISCQLMDTSDDATAAAVFTVRFLATAYTIAQYDAAPINTPRWTV